MSVSVGSTTYQDGYHENGSAIGLTGLSSGVRQGIYEQSSTIKAPIGTRLAFDDGRVFRYGGPFVAALTVGKLAAQDFSVSGFLSIDGKFVDSAGTAKDTYTTTDDVIYLKDTDTFSTADVADVYAGGYLQITDAAGEGYQYRIRSNNAGSESVAGVIKIELHDKLVAALDSETSCGIIGNQYRNLRGATTTDILVAGVTPRSMTQDYYGWVQTWGWANVLYDVSAGTVAQGAIAVLSDGVEGAVTILAQGTAIASEVLITSDFNFAQITTEPLIGYMGDASSNTEYGPVYLQLCW